jgi:hypothetical protein
MNLKGASPPMFTTIMVILFLFLALILGLLKFCGFLFFTEFGRRIQLVIRWALIISAFVEFGLVPGILAFFLCSKYTVACLFGFIYGFRKG